MNSPLVLIGFKSTATQRHDAGEELSDLSGMEIDLCTIFEEDNLIFKPWLGQ